MPRLTGVCVHLLWLPCWVGCAEPTWSVESEALSGSLTLLDAESEACFEFVVDTSHRGRVQAVVTLPGVALPVPEPTPDVDIPTTQGEQESDPGKLVVAELSLGDAHSLVTLPGSGGELSTTCSGESCEGEVAQLLIRALDDADLGTRGIIIKWSALAETFGNGEAAPPDAMATLESVE